MNFDHEFVNIISSMIVISCPLKCTLKCMNGFNTWGTRNLYIKQFKTYYTNKTISKIQGKLTRKSMHKRVIWFITCIYNTLRKIYFKNMINE